MVDLLGTSSFKWVMHSRSFEYFARWNWPLLVILCLVWPMSATCQLQDSSRTAVSVGLVDNMTFGKRDYQVSVERNLAPKISCLGLLGLQPFSRPVNYGYQRFSWTVAVEGRYYFAARNRLLMSGAYAGPYMLATINWVSS
jgi:hypothetical protein